ncbi:MAG: alpha/beta fold hydrolase, partial [Clostridia bacterium]|nr:alpha/beta fold hydrolase [Clostridia bacterium]
YFAKPYAESGFNIFVFDQRAHGMSDGHCNTLGFEESKDLLKWCEYLHDELGTGDIYLHGICIGSACGLYALVDEHAPDYILGLTADGMYSNFFRSFINHALEKVKHLYPVTHMVDWWMRLFTGYSMKKGPIDCIDRCTRPLLMLHSREDTYSVPEYAEQLYAKSNGRVKKLIWFEHGQHSMLRYTDKAKYDSVIKEYLKTNFGGAKS